MSSNIYEPIMPESPKSSSLVMSALCSVVIFSLLSPVTGCDSRERDRTKIDRPPRKESAESKEGERTKKTQQHKQAQTQEDSGSKIKQNKATPVRIPHPSESFRPLKQSVAERLVQLSLDCVGREYPNKPGDVQSSDKDVLPPQKLHPAFYGCFDWHSAVHGHYTMVRVLNKFPNIQVADQIRKTLDQHLDANRIRAEAAYFEGKNRKLFERPYGWAWLLRLAAEIRAMKAPTAKAEPTKESEKQNLLNAKKWAEALEPLEKVIVKLTIEYLSKLSLPVRAGTHHSTAFALAHIHDYARITGHKELEQSVNKAARKFFIFDRDCPTAYEPSGEDFISPCLAEADLMRRILPPKEFRRWLSHFLPPFSDSRFESLLRPPKVTDRKDPKIGHLIGLMFHRAWTFKGIAESLGKQDARTSILKKLSVLHENEGLRLMFDSGYGGTHWLASFAVFSFTDANIREPELLPTSRTSGDPEPANSAN